MQPKTTLKQTIGFGLLALLMTLSISAHAYDLVVAKDGTGNYTTVQAAINAAPTGRTSVYTIFIKNGTYKEKISVPANKPFLQLTGESVARTILTYDDYSGKPMPGGGTYGTSNSASVTISAADFSAINVTFENTTGDAPQALAINVSADRAAFRNCRFLGGQDTLLANGNGLRQYFRDCYIDGVVDFIFGSSVAVFEGCIIYAKTRQDGLSGSYITAANTPAGQTYGYVFRNCKLPANRGTTTYVLGRPWQNSCGSSPISYPKVVFLNTTMSNVVKPEGWAVWDACTNTSSIFYAEYQSRDFAGGLLSTAQRVPWSYQLTDAQAATYTNANLFGSWNPCAVAGDFCTSTPAPIAASNFKGVKGNTTSTFTWNSSWPVAGVTYELFRASTRTGTYARISEVTTANEADVNFTVTDAVPVPGTSYFYYLRGAKTGLASHITDTLQISSVPTITTAGTLSNFLQGVGQPSASQIYTVAGANLTTPIVVTPPASYQISPDGGTTWYGSSTPLSLPVTNTAVPTTTITVRLNAAAAGTYAGNITHTSAGAAPVSGPVTGTVQSTPLPVAFTLLHWPMSVSNADSAAIRSSAVTASTPTLSRLYLSTSTTVPAYSRQQGQALSASSSGDGTWTTASGGPGGNLNRKVYEQFTVTAGAGRAVKVDSLLLKASFILSSSNTKLAVLYSLSNFTADSASVTGGIGLGSPLLSSANGAFATPILLGQENSTTTNSYRLALAGSTGVTVPAGRTLTLRVYLSCGSSSAGRYAKLKDVQVKGNVVLPTTTQSSRGSLVLQAYPNPGHDYVTVVHPPAGRQAQVFLYAFDGRRVATYPVAASATHTVLPLGRLANGSYLVRYADGGAERTVKLIKQ